MAQDALLSEMIARAASENAAAVDPVAAPQLPKSSKGGKLATLIYLAGLGADVGTTAYGTGKGLTEEANPLMKAFGNKGAAPLAAGTSLAGYFLARKLLKNKPKLLKAFLAGTGGAHGLAALGNVGQINKAQRLREAPIPSGPTLDMPPFPGAVRFPDGGWGNPDFFPGLK